MVTVVHSSKDMKLIKSLQVPQHIQVLVVLCCNYKSQFPSNVKVIHVPERLFSLKGTTFTKLLTAEFGETFKNLLVNSPILNTKRPDSITLK